MKKKAGNFKSGNYLKIIHFAAYFFAAAFVMGSLWAGCISAQAEETETFASHTLKVNSGEWYENSWSEKLQNNAAEVAYPSVSLAEESAGEFPELQKSLESLNQEKKKKQLKELKSLKKQAMENWKNDKKNFRTLYAKEEVDVRRADTQVLSLLYHGEVYEGGMHGMEYYWGETMDTAAGEKLKLTDVVSDMDALAGKIEKQLEKFYSDVEFYQDLDVKAHLMENVENISWVLDYHGLTIFFNPYEIAPYAYGVQVVNIPYYENSELFLMDLHKIPESYGVELSCGVPYRADLNQDGTTDTLLITYLMDEYGTIEEQYIYLNSKCLKVIQYGFAVNPVLLQDVDGKKYLYIESTSENDYRTINVFDLNGKKAKKTGSVFSGFHSSVSEEAEYFPERAVLTDPGKFILDTPTETLGTISGCQVYHMGKNGLPVAEGIGYQLVYSRKYTLKCSIKAMLIDEAAGEEKKKVTLKKGERVTYFRTDNKSYADLRRKDGTAVRVYLKHKDWYYTIDGKPVAKIFKGIIYAG